MVTLSNFKISVIVPVYNCENYLRKCINSILDQTYKNLEIIIVNDGSTDSSFQICQEYKRKDDRVILLNKENGGLSSARNLGLSQASGAFISFVDSDDYIEKNMLELLVNNLVKTKSDISICSFYTENEEGVELQDYQSLKNCKLTNLEILKLLSYKGYDKYVVSWNKLYKKSLFNGLEFPIGRIHEDQFLAHKIFFKAKKISTMSNKLYHYIIRENSLSHQKNPIMHLDDIDALFDRIEFYKQNSLKSMIYDVENIIFEIFKFYKKKFYSFGDFSKGEINLIKSYANRCYEFYKECKKYKRFSRMELKERKKVYRISLLDTIRFKYTKRIKSKNGFIAKIYKKVRKN